MNAPLRFLGIDVGGTHCRSRHWANIRQAATQTDQDAFATAFQNYSVAVYRPYLMRYAGQTLKVVGSSEHAPDDIIVRTQMTDPHGDGHQQKLEIDFRVRTDAGRPGVIDLGIAGTWLALEERDFLAQHHGNIADLTIHLYDIADGCK